MKTSSRQRLFNFLAFSSAFLMVFNFSSYAQNYAQNANDLIPGTGVRGGGPTDREARKAEILSDFNERFKGQRRIQEKMAKQIDISDWCNFAAVVLKRELAAANKQIYYNQLDSAFVILQDALTNLSSQIELGDSTGPMTKALIDRGVILAKAIDETLTDTDGEKMGVRAVKSKIDFLTRYVEFIIETNENLDQSWYIPYYYHYRHRQPQECKEFNFRELEIRYLKFAAKQLRFAYENFTTIVYSDGRYRVYSIGPDKTFFKLAELSAAFVAEDLSNNLYADHFIRQIEELKSLSRSLSKLNTSGIDSTEWVNHAHARSTTREILEQSAERISPQFREP